MEKNSDTPPSTPDQVIVDQKLEKNGLLNTQVTNRSNDHRIRHFVESDRVKSLVMFYGHEKPSTDNNRLDKAKIVNFPHLARLANILDPIREVNRINGVVISSSNCREIRSNKRVAEEALKIEKNDKKMKMKIDEGNSNIVPPDEHSRVIAGEFDDYRRASVSASNEDSGLGCSSEDVHEEMDSDERTVDNKRSRTTHHDRQRKRKDKMKKKMLALQELLPGCNKVVDKASVLDEAIEYVKTLQHQLQVMSIGHLFMPTPMMIPSVTTQLIMPTLNQFSPHLSSTGICLGMGSGFGLGLNPQVSGMPGFTPMSCVTAPYEPGLGEGAGANLLGSWGTRTTSFQHHQLGSSSAPPLSSYNNDSSNAEDLSENMRRVPKPKDK